MFVVSSSFIGNFKLGDNINHNLKVAKLLYSNFETADGDEKRLLCKPIILCLVSITEAVLHDFHYRIQMFTWEGVENLASTVVDYVRGKKLDELEKYIVSARKHDFFGAGKTNFYERLDELRRLRNRIHIQNVNNDFEPDEYNAFTELRKTQAEKVLETTLKIMSRKYSRGAEFNYVADFELPWNEHFPTLAS